MNWLSSAKPFLDKRNYQKVVDIYEQEINQHPDNITNYWYLGLAYLLQNQEEDAQSIWFAALTQGMDADLTLGTQSLIEVLESEAQRQERLKKYDLSELICWQIFQLDSSLVNNSLEMILLAFKQQKFNPQLLEDLEIIETLKQADEKTVNLHQLQTVISQALYYPTLETIAFLEASLSLIHEPQAWIERITQIAIEMAYD